MAKTSRLGNQSRAGTLGLSFLDSLILRLTHHETYRSLELFFRSFVRME